jgi:hypothetical protein
MANLTAYGTGTPKASDLLLGTKTAAPNTNEENITQNFTVSSVAAFANTYSLGYTLYVAALTQSGATPPVATVLQNTTGATFTWGYTNTGQYTLTSSSAILTANKVAMFISENNGNNSLGGTIASTTLVNVDQIDIGGGGGYIDGMAAGTSIEIRIYS